MKEEIECLAAIYGDENVLFDTNSRTLKVDLRKHDRLFTLVIQLSSSYPSNMPSRLSIRATPSVPNDYLARVEACVKTCMESCLDETYLSDAVMALQDYLAEHPVVSEVVSSEVISADSMVTHWIVALKIDHIRNRQKYFKHLKKWSRELRVGLSLFILKGIRFVVVLEGDKFDVDQFLVNWKTQCVDVDSRGKPCKEKLLTVSISERSWSLVNRTFVLHESEDLSSFDEVFEKFDNDLRSELRQMLT